MAVNCAAVVETLTESELFGHERGAFTGAVDRRQGCFERASDGTLLLDEIGDASQGFQAKLLRVLDRGEFHRVGGRDLLRASARVLSATNRDLEALVAAGEFREDLYYRLCEVSVRVPPLRERAGDIPDLAKWILDLHNRRSDRPVRGISDEALECLLAHSWPGNVRELQNVLTRAAIGARVSVILPGHLQGMRGTAQRPSVTPVRTLNEIERTHIFEVLEITGWNRGRACQLLGITRPTLRRKMRRYGLASADQGECIAADGD